VLEDIDTETIHSHEDLSSKFDNDLLLKISLHKTLSGNSLTFIVQL